MIVKTIRNSKQYDLIDLSKYIGSVFVVFIHTLPDGIGEQLGNVIGRFAVPFFLIVSAYFYTNKLSKNDEGDRNRLIIQYVARIFRLYLFWMILNSPFILYNSVNYFRSSTFGIWKTSLLFVLSCVYNAVPGYGISWYLTTSMFSAAILGRLYFKHSSLSLLFYTLPFFLISVFSSTYGSLIRKMGPIAQLRALFSPANSLFAGLFFFSLGMVLFDHRHFWMVHVSKPVLISITVLALICSIVEANVAIHYNLPYAAGTTDQYFMLFPLSFFLVVLCLKFQVKLLFAKICRKASTVTYLSQFIFIFSIKFFCMKLNLNINQYFLALLTVAGTFILFLILNSFEKKFPRFLKYAF